MAAVIRVKRRINEEPLDAFILNCKRPRLEENNDSAHASDETSTILKFAGTVNNQDDIYKLTKEDAQKIITKKRNPDVLTKSRDDTRQISQNNRFKIINCSRPVEFTTDDAKPITVVDIEKQHNDGDDGELAAGRSDAVASSSRASSAITNSTDDGNYVYDVYVPDGGTETDLSDNIIENMLSVQPFDLVYDRRGDGGNESDSDDDTESDSNSESNWRNEYPDSDDGASVGSEDMRHAVENMKMDEDCLSSDDDDEEGYKNGFVYSVDSDNIGFEDDVDYCDVVRYGEAYARYRARVLKEVKPKNKDYDEEEDVDEDKEEHSDLDDYYSD